MVYLWMKFPRLFFNKERIIRTIYSKRNVNPNTNTPKANFFQFRYNSETDKMELSCTRFELDSLEYCRFLGRHYEDSAYDRTYYGFGCTTVALIKQLATYDLIFTPKLNIVPKNYFHSDVYDGSYAPGQTQMGVANLASVNYQKDIFAQIWKPFRDSEIISSKTIQGPTLQTSNP
jgi:hypothetical protein